MSVRDETCEALLLDCAAGAAGPATELLVATHLSMSSENRALYCMMEAVGGALLEELDGEPLERISAGGALEGALSASDHALPPDLGDRDAKMWGKTGAGAEPTSFRRDDLPLPLLSVQSDGADGLYWRRLGLGVAAAKLTQSDAHERAHLLWAKGGTGIARHRHVGREVVLVLKGAFWDAGVRFGPGEVAVSEDGSIHAPRIDHEEDCLCLAVTEAPVHFVGPLGWALNRFSRF